ncbi:MAG: NAD(+) synthase [Planctomycetota bacterium]|nr:NAD(+) synthase [Planctomycetota bacterium]
MPITTDVLNLDAASETDRIVARLREQVHATLRRKGTVVGLSGGIDSSVSAALCVRAFGASRVLGLLMPEAESAGDTLHLSNLIARHLGIQTVLENITPILESVGCYRRRDDAIRSVIPQYGTGYRCKIILPSLLKSESYRIFSIVVQAPDGRQIKARLSLEAYLTIVAATNFKQRARKMLEYYHADRLHYAVVGTPNRLEYDQGFFVKNGDGSADVKPIAHLYKTQVYQLAAHLGIPQQIRERPPTTDTYSLAQSQEEFFFTAPYDTMDVCLYALDNQIPADEVADAVGLTPEQVNRIYRDIAGKRRSARYLHLPPLLVEHAGAQGA